MSVTQLTVLQTTAEGLGFSICQCISGFLETKDVMAGVSHGLVIRLQSIEQLALDCLLNSAFLKNSPVVVC